MPLYEVLEGQSLAIEGPATVVIQSSPHDPVINEGEPATLDSLDPTDVEVGGPDITLRCIGTNFSLRSRIIFNGNEEVTAFVSPEELRTTVKTSLFAVAADCPVAIRTGSQETAPQTFSFVEPGASRSGKGQTRGDHRKR